MMVQLACTVAVLLLAGSVLGQGETDRISVGHIVACGSLSQDACHIVKACTFCRSKWGEAMCFAEEQVDRLPADVYPCKYFKAAVTATACDDLGKDQCLGTGSCAWCQSAAVGNACYTAADAKRLPAAIFNCTAGAGPSATPAGAPTEAVVAEIDDKPSLLDSSDVAGVSRRASVQPGGAGQATSTFTIGTNPQAFAFGEAQQLDGAVGAEQDAPADPAP